MEEIVETMRKAFYVQVQHNPGGGMTQNSFSISYEGKVPETAMIVTNRLASMLIEENLKVRESQAEGTSEFLVRELAAMEGQLKRKEQEIRDFRERNMGQLPGQLDANLRILAGVQHEYGTTDERIRAIEDRRIILQNQIQELKRRHVARQEEEGFPKEAILELDKLKRDLGLARWKYTETHPDVVDLKKKVVALEPKVKELIDQYEAAKEDRGKKRDKRIAEINSVTKLDPDIEGLLGQYTQQNEAAGLEIRRLREEQKSLKEQIYLYQRRIEDTPKREQELTLLTRDYDLLKSNYESLLNKKIQSEMAKNLERTHQSEQFKILDPARLPEKPVKPDRNKILLIGAMMGLMAGLGLTWFRESLDRSFHSVSDVELYLAIPVIATIPNLAEEKKRTAHSA
jgi:polysaccharide chain length determinant protein (PEP-CTERM system associated)